MAPLEHAAIAHRTPLMRQSTLARCSPRIDARRGVIVAFESVKLFLDNGSVTGPTSRPAPLPRAVWRFL
jgi:hypothetical protein